ncbi:hypothetical protein ACFFSW_21310 [Saccharothrix longispora]|uniref:Uncharacterized protein n=1 Tax=Saccharothrix longispora TaxID=33920 RepID=A0ABU1Q785_9PSEU|nr:hypothetical protein [Saccharothrix longispora]MDR6598378.1 hypothetical protein [Saccharothrix longispora]
MPPIRMAECPDAASVVTEVGGAPSRGDDQSDEPLVDHLSFSKCLVVGTGGVGGDDRLGGAVVVLGAATADEITLP